MSGTTIFGISKTTINGVLALLITILTGVLSYQVPTALLTPQVSHTWLWVTAVATFLCGILRALVGFVQGDAPAATPNLSSKIPLILLAALIIPVGLLTGCPRGWEQQAQAALASSKATIDGAQAAYEASAQQPGGSCAAVTTPCLAHHQAAYDAINRAKEGQRTAVDAMETYEQLKATNAASATLQQAQNDVGVALAALPKLIADVKAFYGQP